MMNEDANREVKKLRRKETDEIGKKSARSKVSQGRGTPGNGALAGGQELHATDRFIRFVSAGE